MKLDIFKREYINTIDEFKEIYEREKQNNNIKECYYQVYYHNSEMITFNNFDDCLIYIKKDYENTKDEYFTELDGYKIGLLLYTKPINYEGIVYDYEYDIDFKEVLI